MFMVVQSYVMNEGVYYLTIPHIQMIHDRTFTGLGLRIQAAIM